MPLDLLPKRFLVILTLLKGQCIHLGIADTEDCAKQFVTNYCFDQFQVDLVKHLPYWQADDDKDVQIEYDLSDITYIEVPIIE